MIWAIILSEPLLYVADTFNHKIRKITTSGSVSTIAGSDQGFGDGQGTSAMFNTPQGIAVVVIYTL
jgi:hypothetical protein